MDKKTDYKEITTKAFDPKWWDEKKPKHSKEVDKIKLSESLKKCSAAGIGKNGLPTSQALAAGSKKIGEIRTHYNTLEDLFTKIQKACGAGQADTKKAMPLFIAQISAGRDQIVAHIKANSADATRVNVADVIKGATGSFRTIVSEVQTGKAWIGTLKGEWDTFTNDLLAMEDAKDDTRNTAASNNEALMKAKIEKCKAMDTSCKKVESLMAALPEPGSLNSDDPKFKAYQTQYGQILGAFQGLKNALDQEMSLCKDNQKLLTGALKTLKDRNEKDAKDEDLLKINSGSKERAKDLDRLYKLAGHAKIQFTTIPGFDADIDEAVEALLASNGAADNVRESQKLMKEAAVHINDVKKKLGALNSQFKKMSSPANFDAPDDKEAKDYENRYKILATDINRAAGQYKGSLQKITLLRDTLDNATASV